jgi:hypothetical protein
MLISSLLPHSLVDISIARIATPWGTGIAEIKETDYSRNEQEIEQEVPIQFPCAAQRAHADESEI